MPVPTAEQIRTLAPDAAAARAGEALARPGRWSGAGRTDSAAWGLCQGSGSSPYQVAVDLDGPAYRCSCPSKKIPCKHALGLLFLLADGKVKPEPAPDWVAEWLAARASRAAAAATRAERTAAVDPAARAKRVESRERKVAGGIDELDRWLGDLVRRGLDSARGEGYRFWDAMGARLVDAQAAGLGRSVRALGSAASAGEAWPHLLLEGAARLHLLTEAYRRADDLPEPLRADVRSLVGWTTKEEDLDPSDSVEDRWLVVGRRVDDSGQIITARTFLMGEGCGRFALHLAFGVDAAPPTVLAVPGRAFQATLTFYPSSTPLRALVRPVLLPDGEVAELSATETIPAVIREHAERLGRNPFVDRWPVAVGPVVPVLRAERLLLRGEDGTALEVVPSSLGPRLLAISGGRPATIVGEWDGAAIRPLGVLAESRLVGIETWDTGPAVRVGGAEWSALVSAALLGTERVGEGPSMPAAAEPVLAEVDGASREHRLLAAAGILAVRARAGRGADRDDEPPPEPAAADPRSATSSAVARLIGLVVTEERLLLPEVLGLLRVSGRRLPDEWLPELLAIAQSDDDVRASIVGLVGPRAAWLGAMVPELADMAPVELGDDWEASWQAASGPARRATVAVAMRAADRSAAGQAIARWIPALPGPDRVAVIESLEPGLGPDDEPLLATALDDRRVDVRRAAADLLVRIDGSALAGLVESRARPLVAGRGRLRPGIAVTLPALDRELESAGFGGKAPEGLGERASLLRQLVAHVRPARWSEWLSVDPRALVERALKTDEARPLLEGWIEAAARFKDPSWAAALLAEPKVAAVVRVDPRRALIALPPVERAAVVGDLAQSFDPNVFGSVVELCQPPWRRPLVDAVLLGLSRHASTQYPDQVYYRLARAASIGLPPARADDFATLASYREEIRPALVSAVETIGLRARIHAAFADQGSI